MNRSASPVLRLSSFVVSILMVTPPLCAGSTTQLELQFGGLAMSSPNSTMTETFTGTLSLTNDANSALVAVTIDGVGQSVFCGVHLLNFQGSITLSAGRITDGSFVVQLSNGDTFISNITSGVGAKPGATDVASSFGFSGPFIVSGLMVGGSLSGATFDGVNAGAWKNNEPIPGSFIGFKIGPGGTDNDVDISLFLEAPSPVLPVTQNPVMRTVLTSGVNGPLWPVIGIGGATHPFGIGPWNPTAVCVWDPPGVMPETLFASFSSGGLSRLAFWDGVEWFPISGALDGEVLDMVATSSLFVGGTFSSADGVSSPGVASWRPTAGWGALPGLSASDEVRTVIIGLDGKPFAGGRMAGGVREWTGSAWRRPDVLFNGVGGPSSTVNDLAWTTGGAKGGLIAVGQFESMNTSITMANASRLQEPIHDSTWSMLTDGFINIEPDVVGVNGVANAVVCMGESAIIGGGFSVAAGLGDNFINVKNITRFDLTGLGPDGGVSDPGGVPDNFPIQVLSLVPGTTTLTVGTANGVYQRSGNNLQWLTMARFENASFNTIAHMSHGSPLGVSTFVDDVPQNACAPAVPDAVGRLGVAPPQLGLFVSGVGAISNVFDFGSLPIGDVANHTIIVRNSGALVLGVRKSTASTDVSQIGFPFSGTSTLLPGASFSVPISFSSLTPGDFVETVILETNDPRNPVVSLTLTGSAHAICPIGDLTGDGVVDGADLSIVLSAFGASGNGLLADISGDGVVDSVDMAYLLNVFGPCT